MTNFFRNWGGSFGIAFVNTMSERRFDFHQSVVAANLQASSRASQPRVNEAAAYVHARIFRMSMLNELHSRVHLLAFMDCRFRLVGILWLTAAPLVLLTRLFTVGSSGSSAH
jgi:DHA2 family multidrug resistance protein